MLLHLVVIRPKSHFSFIAHIHQRLTMFCNFLTEVIHPRTLKDNIMMMWIITRNVYPLIIIFHNTTTPQLSWFSPLLKLCSHFIALLFQICLVVHHFFKLSAVKSHL